MALINGFVKYACSWLQCHIYLRVLRQDIGAEMRVNALDLPGMDRADAM